MMVPCLDTCLIRRFTMAEQSKVVFLALARIILERIAYKSEPFLFPPGPWTKPSFYVQISSGAYRCGTSL